MTRRRPGTVFAWPLLIAALSLIGLVGALLGHGAWDAAGAILLGLCLILPLRRLAVAFRG